MNRIVLVLVASLLAAFLVIPAPAEAETLWDATFKQSADAEQMLVRGIGPFYVRRLLGEHEVRSGAYTLRNAIRVTEQQIIADSMTLTCEFRVRPQPHTPNYHGYIGVVDFRGVETYLVGWRGPGDYESYQMKGRLGRARETFFKQKENTDYKGRVSYEPICEPTEESPTWHTLVLTWSDGVLRGAMDGEDLGERKLKLFPGEGLGLAFLAWDANVDVRRIRFDSNDPEARTSTRVMPGDHFVRPHYKFEPVRPDDEELIRKVEYKPIEKPEPLTEPLKAYFQTERGDSGAGFKTSRDTVAVAGRVAEYARNWRFTGSEGALELMRRDLAILRGIQDPDGALLKGGWVDSHKYYMWRVSVALDEAYRMTGDPRILEVLRGVNDWAMSAPMSRNMNYNTVPINLAMWFKHDPDRRYMDLGWKWAREGILDWQEYNGVWSGHNGHIWYSGIGMRVLSYLAEEMPEDHPAYEPLTRALRAATNQVILAQAPNGGLYETWDRLENEYNVRVDVVHPKPSVFDATTLLRIARVFDNDPTVLNAAYGLMRWLHENHGFTFDAEDLPGRKGKPLPPMPGDTSKQPLPPVVTVPPEKVKEAVEPVQFGVTWLHDKGQLLVASRLHPETDLSLASPIGISYRVTLWGDNETLIQGGIQCPPTGENKQLVTPKRELPDGKYLVEVSFTMPDKTQRSWRRHFYKRSWPWLNAELGLSDAVIPPFTPVKVDGRDVAVWGRQYRLSPQGLPEQIVNQGQGMLAAPVRLIARAGERALEFKPDDPGEFIQKGRTRALRTQTLTAGKAKIEMTTSVEYDGLVQVDMTLSGGKSAELSVLDLEVPLNADMARYGRIWSQSDQVLLTLEDKEGVLFSSDADIKPNETLKGTFVPYVYLGDESHGLAWFADSDEGYSVPDDQPVVEIVRDGEAVVLRVHVVSGPLANDRPRHVVFNLQASPVKAMPSKWRSFTFVSDGGVPSSPMAINCFGSTHWSRGLNRLYRPDRPPPPMEEARRRIADPAREELSANMWTQYWPVNVINGAVPEYEEFRVPWGDSIYHDFDPGEFEPTERANQYGSRHPQDDQLGHSPSALAPSMIDYRAWASLACNVYAVAASPTARYLPEGGFGYVREDGHQQPTYNILALRELFQRIAVLNHQTGKALNYLVIGGWEATMVPVGSFALAGRSGTILTREHWKNPAVLHTALRGNAAGVITATGNFWHSYGEDGSRESLAVALANDIRGFQLEDLEMSPRVDNLLQGFGIGEGDCRFVGYWAQRAAETEDSGVMVSFYKRPGRTLAIIANATDKPTIRLKLNAGKLGVTEDIVRDAERDYILTADEDGWLEMDITPYQYRILWIGPVNESWPYSD